MRGAFRFSLQKVLEMRERSEKETARGLVEAEGEAAAARRAREDLEVAREAGRSGLARAHGSGTAVGHLQNLAYVVDRYDDRIRDAEAECEQAEQRVAERRASYHEAFKRRKTLQELRERRLGQWRQGEARAEQKILDEAALVRHSRADGE